MFFNIYLHISSANDGGYEHWTPSNSSFQQEAVACIKFVHFVNIVDLSFLGTIIFFWGGGGFIGFLKIFFNS